MRARQSRRSRIVALALLVVTVGVTVSVTTSSAAPAKQQKTIVIAYSDPLASEPALRSIGYGMKQAIRTLRLPWKVLESDAQLSSDKQVSGIDSFTNQKVSAITSWTLGAGAAEPAYKRARAAGIPVIGYNSPSPSFNTTINNQTDSTCAVSKAQAAYIAKRIPHAKVLALPGMEFVPSISFTNKCFFAAAKANGLEILDKKQITGNGSQTDEAQRFTTDMIAKNPEFDAVWTYADTVAIGTAAALAAAGKKVWNGSGKRDGLILISRDGNKVAIDLIKKGRMTATFDPHYEQSGAAAIQVLKPYLTGKKPLSSLPKKVYIKATLWDSKNAAKYRDQLTRKVILPLPRS